ncbi:Ribosomal RNA small subunit methyltransferase H [Rhynchospora pubera]|uniref:Ribosomal RNA small subunit methyltransferase H n=1 Tax=Rhynchospora pubera TaxID=906938 RepID=A0AAV8HC66_9POAL|nr:Ribosomal RNA small subunit methyltransferase H [Rhynchospora pubera]
MEPVATEPAPPVSEIDDWDNDDFVIPSLTVSESKHDSWDEPGAGVIDQKPPPKSKIKEAETLYLGPHGAPPQAKLKVSSTTSNWNHTNNNTIKPKPKEAADRKYKPTDQRDFQRHHSKEIAKRHA